MSNMIISEATAKNWERLNTDPAGRLTRRANKKQSGKIIISTAYAPCPESIKVLEKLQPLDASLPDIIYTLCSLYLKKIGSIDKAAVVNMLSDSDYSIVDALTEDDIPTSETDWLGFIYQSLHTEGYRNTHGLYYTMPDVVKIMTDGLDFSKGQTFLDPCCGSGAFFLHLKGAHPTQIFGVDIDPTAVLIAKTNLFGKYKHLDFTPQIYCCDFLSKLDLAAANLPIATLKFDYIITNPPWGVKKKAPKTNATIQSGERASLFLIKAFEYLRDNGSLNFVLPSAILHINAHKDIRQFILDNTSLKEIVYHSSSFTGVYTNFISLKLQPKIPGHTTVTIIKDNNVTQVDTAVFHHAEGYTFTTHTPQDSVILEKAEQLRHDDLSHSTWALGIVTGNNAEILSSSKEAGYEAIYTGKEIEPYRLKQAQNYLLYERGNFQQVAREEYYRASEKLVYKFISNKLVFAYDAEQRLFLNSANILIPQVDTLSAKSVMAFLNSELYQWIFRIKFGDIKILKGNLQKLPFPKLSCDENNQLTALVNSILNGDTTAHTAVNLFIYAKFQITKEEQTHIKTILHGKPL